MSFCSNCRSSVKTATEAAFLSTTGAGGRGSRSRTPKSVAQALRSTLDSKAGRARAMLCGMRVFFDFNGVDRSTRHADAEMGTGEFAVHDLHGAAVRGDEFEHDRQPDAGAFDRRAFGGPSSVESFEHVRSVFDRNARPAVGDIQLQQLACGTCAKVDSTSLGRVLHGVGYQVLEDQPNLAAIRDERHIFDAHI